VHAHQRVGCDPRLDVVRARTGLLREQCGERVRVAAEDLALAGLAPARPLGTTRSGGAQASSNGVVREQAAVAANLQRRARLCEKAPEQHLIRRDYRAIDRGLQTRDRSRRSSQPWSMAS
jgi:hypothetical protein